MRQTARHHNLDQFAAAFGNSLKSGVARPPGKRSQLGAEATLRQLQLHSVRAGLTHRLLQYVCAQRPRRCVQGPDTLQASSALLYGGLRCSNISQQLRGALMPQNLGLTPQLILDWCEGECRKLQAHQLHLRLSQCRVALACHLMLGRRRRLTVLIVVTAATTEQQRCTKQRPQH
jgi:hypothetical protein